MGQFIVTQLGGKELYVCTNPPPPKKKKKQKNPADGLKRPYSSSIGRASGDGTDVQADRRKSWTYGRAPTPKTPVGCVTCLSKHRAQHACPSTVLDVPVQAPCLTCLSKHRHGANLSTATLRNHPIKFVFHD